MTVIPWLAACLVLVAVVWRLASRRHSIPCPVWLRWMVELDNPFTRTNRAAVIIEFLELEPGMSVLDAGCGPGRLAIPLARAVGARGQVTAVDVQEGMLNRVREKAEGTGLTNIRYVHAALGEGILPCEAFDRALLVTVLGEIPNREAAVAELYSALKPGGFLSVTEVIFDPHFQRRATVSALATAAGFQERAFAGNRFAYTIHFVKPAPSELHRSAQLT
jgi:ubiquinone/menaquinone biosynthesis C-methylase UbiE